MPVTPPPYGTANPKPPTARNIIALTSAAAGRARGEFSFRVWFGRGRYEADDGARAGWWGGEVSGGCEGCGAEEEWAAKALEALRVAMTRRKGSSSG
jgi:hypothetical protein